MVSFTTTKPHEPLPTREPAVFPRHADKVIFVTGAAGGVGLATVKRLVAEGAFVVATDVVEQEIEKARLSDKKFAERVHFITLDVADPAQVGAAFKEGERQFGPIAGLVNCAAIVLHADALDTTLDDWAKIFGINVFGAFEVAKHAAKSMIATGTRGAIVNVASEAGKKGHTESLAYSASKASLISITRMLAEVLAPHDINVNSVCPGGVATNMLREVAVAYGARVDRDPDEVFPQLHSSQVGRLATPEEIAGVISFLLSDDALLIRGQAVNADGGDTPY